MLQYCLSRLYQTWYDFSNFFLCEFREIYNVKNLHFNLSTELWSMPFLINILSKIEACVGGTSEKFDHCLKSHRLNQRPQRLK